MENWYLLPDGNVKHSSGQILAQDKIQDQIDEGRIQLVEWIGSPEQMNEASQSLAQSRIKDAIEQIAVLEQKALRNIIALSKTETKKERDYLNDRIAQIESLRAEINGIIEEAAPSVSLWTKLKAFVGL